MKIQIHTTSVLAFATLALGFHPVSVSAQTGDAKNVAKTAPATPDRETLKAAIASQLPKFDQALIDAFLKAREAETTAEGVFAKAQAALGKKGLKDKEGAEKALKSAQDELAKAQEASAAATTAMLQKAGPFLAGDSLDDALVKAALIAGAGNADLSSCADLLADPALMKQMLVAGGAKFGKYPEAMRIYRAILAASPRAKDGMFQRLALATALEHADPIEQKNPASQTGGPAIVDPVKRYAHYEKAFLDGELDPAFKDLNVWEYRMVVNCDAPDETLAWGRAMLRNYRPDHITTPAPGWRYSIIVKTDVLYGSKDQVNDDPSLQFYQNIIANGGVCGRRAFFARFLLRSFGIPVWGVTQKGHAAVGRWTPNGWLVNLGAAFKWSWWDRDEDSRSGTDFLLETQARRDAGEYLKVLRAQWISTVLGETAYNHRKSIPGGFWSALANAECKAIAARLNAEELGPVGQDIAESNESKEAVAIQKTVLSEDDRKITTDASGTITIPAIACGKTSNVIIAIRSHGDGGQLHVNRDLKSDQSFHYTFDAPKAGKYALTANVVTVQRNQKLTVAANGSEPSVEIPLPYTIGMWQTTEPVVVMLNQGKNELQFTRPADPGRGVSIKEFKLTPVN